MKGTQDGSQSFFTPYAFFHLFTSSPFKKIQYILNHRAKQTPQWFSPLPGYMPNDLLVDLKSRLWISGLPVFSQGVPSARK